MHLLKNWRTPKEEVGKIPRIVYAWTAEVVGVTYPLLEKPKQHLPHIKGKLIPALRDALSKVGAKITVDNNYIWPKLRENDCALMDIALKMEFTDK